MHTEQVVKAKTTIQDDQFFTTQAANAKISKKINTAVYEGKSAEFWRKTDNSGELSIQLAQEIRKRWNVQAEIETKKTKIDGEKSHEHE